MASGARRLYRTKTPGSGATYARVAYDNTTEMDLTEQDYRIGDTRPDFDELPWDREGGGEAKGKGQDDAKGS